VSRITLRLSAACWRLPFLAPAAVVMALGLMLCGQGLWIPAKAALAQVLLERAFERSLATGRPVKPWPWADTWPVARISFPRLHRQVIVLDGASGQALAFGPGHMAGTPDAWDAAGLDPHAPGRALALATCWPLAARTHGPLRYLVWANLSQPAQAEKRNHDDQSTGKDLHAPRG
jgi:sortase A